MAETREELTYLEGRIAAVEWACAILMNSMPIIGGISIMERALKEAEKQVTPESESGFKRGFSEGVDRVVDSARKLQSSGVRYS